MYSLTIEDSNGQIAEQFSFDHGSYLIGRQEDCDIVLPSSSVSRRHANLYVDGGRCYIEDLNSANGVQVDGERVIDHKHLGTASQVRIGDYFLYLEYQEEDKMSGQDVRKTVFISDDEENHKLVRLDGDLAGEEFPLSEVKNTVGRTDDNFIMLSDPSVSRQHAMITRDGDDYRLVDLGSSNGSEVNGEEVLEPTELQPGDIVTFGDVRFLFVPGDRQVDPEQFGEASSGPSKMLLATSVAVLVLLGLAVGATIVYTFVWMKKQNAGANSQRSARQVSQELKPIMKRGKRQLAREHWDRAIRAFNEALALSPTHSRARKLREKARTEKKAENLYKEAMKLTEDGQHRRALELFREIPKGTKAAENARSMLRSVEKTVAFELRKRAEELAQSDDVEALKKAHEKLKRSLELAPDKPATRKLAQKVENRLDEANVEYDSILE